VLLIWLAGAAVSSVRFVAGTFTTWRSLRRCRAADPARLPAGSDGLSPREDVVVERRRVRFLTGAQVAHPCCWQFHRPCVLLPEFVLRFGSDDVDFIVRHELEHLRRGHPLQLFLERLVGIVFWYHPVVWWASYRSALAREYACDEAAIDSPSDVAAYLRTLLRIVEETGPAERAAPGTLAFGLGAGVVACRARRLVRLARSGEQYSGPHAARSERLLPLALGACLAVAPLAWVPVDALAAPHTAWSPWPAWTARALHDFGVTVRDHETYDRRSRLHELREGSEFHPPPPGREAR
jgi:hypothetical protein